MRETPPLPDTLPIMSLSDAVVFPLEIVPIEAQAPEMRQLVDEAMRVNRLLGLAYRTEGRTPNVAVAATIHRMVTERDGKLRILVQGIERIRLEDTVQATPYPVARIVPFPDREETGPEIEALAGAVRDAFLELAGEVPAPLAQHLRNLVSDPVQLAYLVSANIELQPADRQEILELDPISAKLKRLLGLLQHQRSVRELRTKIEEETRGELSRTQREYILREQLKAIQRELGEKREGPEDDLREQVAKANLPAEAAREVERELDRLERLPEASPEHGVIRTYVEWMVSLPWGKMSAGSIDIEKARQVLDADHYDLEKVKERILEHLAVKKLRQERGTVVADDERREPILCFVGPPGVGKTSLGQSIARAMGRKFTRISLGGVHDETEIRGHRRTYIGPLPGRFIQALRRAEVADPVFMLDEIDKLGTGYRGDPAAALLEILDPAQNKNFVDTYLSVPFDLSNVFFISTANSVETIPGPLLDRMEIIPLSGYTEKEKLGIARRHLMPKLVAAHGLVDGEAVIEEDALAQVVREYTREAGGRDLERTLAQILRKIARRIGEGEGGPIRVTAANLTDFLGKPRYRHDLAERIDRPGIALGLAWTPVGGEVLFVEATMVPSGDERLILTGMLGDVMRESVQAALSYLRSQGQQLGIPDNAFTRKSVHVHVPAGAIPKDGPSAGVAMLTALASLATGRLVQDDVAMTGEITLRGKVLPVGGIKEKLLGAYRAGVKTVILPRANEDSLDDLPDEVRAELRIVLVGAAEQVLATALRPAATERPSWSDQPAPAP